MGDGSEHRYVLLGPFIPPDVVGPQDDIHRAAKEWRPRGRYELWELKPASSAGEVDSPGSRAAAEGHELSASPKPRAEDGGGHSDLKFCLR